VINVDFVCVPSAQLVERNVDDVDFVFGVMCGEFSVVVMRVALFACVIERIVINGDFFSVLLAHI